MPMPTLMPMPSTPSSSPCLPPVQCLLHTRYSIRLLRNCHPYVSNTSVRAITHKVGTYGDYIGLESPFISRIGVIPNKKKGKLNFGNNSKLTIYMFWQMIAVEVFTKCIVLCQM